MQMPSFNMVAPQQRFFSTEDAEAEQDSAPVEEEREDPYKY